MKFRARTLFTSVEGGALLTGSPGAVPVRFLDRAAIASHLIDRGASTDETLVPVAVLGLLDLEGTEPDDEFLSRSFGALLHDVTADALVVVSRDDWSRDHVIDGGLPALELRR